MQHDVHLVPQSFLASNLFYGLKPVNGLLSRTLDYLNQHTKRVVHQPKGLLKLPLELLTNILVLLDWRDILCAKRTCKRLCEATGAKSLWIDLINEFNSLHLCSPLPLERSLTSYASQELEYIFLRRMVTETLRSAKTEMSPVLTRRFPIDESETRFFNILYGGHWLLTISVTGLVSYYDLDLRQPLKNVLISEQLGRSHKSAHGVMMAIDIDHSSVPPSFNLALFMSRWDQSADSPIHITQIWRVQTIHSKGQNLPPRLSATRLSHFYHETHGMPHSITLLGRYFALGVANRTYEPSYVSVIDWVEAGVRQQARPGSVCYSTRIIWVSGFPFQLQLLPDDRLLVLSRSCVCLYDISSGKVTTSAPSPGVHHNITLPAWQIELPEIRRDSLSRIYHSRKTSTCRMVFKTLDVVHGLIIPSVASSTEPKIVKLAEFRLIGETMFSLGYNSALIHGGGRRPHLLCYSWLDDSVVSRSNNLCIEFSGDDLVNLTSSYDEVSGRVAICTNYEVVVLDFVTF